MIVTNRLNGRTATATIGHDETQDREADRLRSTKRRLLELLAANDKEAASKGIPLADEDVTPANSEPWFTSTRKVLEDNPKLRPWVIDSLLRRGEVMNLIAVPKIGKSLLSLGLATALSKGTQWLGFSTIPGKTLIIDNELHAETFSDRLRSVVKATGGDLDRIDAKFLRGQKIDINGLSAQLSRHVKKGEFDLIILDALYRFLPPGVSESDNNGMMTVYNTVDEIAAATGAAIMLVHHTSKGDQSGKAVTDVGSGAGVISRATDTHLVLRQHARESYAVVDVATRSFKSPLSQTICFAYPCWHRSNLEPELRQVKTASEARQEKLDSEADAAVLSAVRESKRRPTERTIRDIVGFGQPRVAKAIKRLIDGKRIELKRVKCGETGKRKEVYAIPQNA
jgi:RecA-family ATPase